MVSSKLPELGMPKWIAFLLSLDSLDAILILMSIPRVGSHLIILVLYVDDLILTGSDSKLLNHVKTNLLYSYEIRMGHGDAALTTIN